MRDSGDYDVLYHELYGEDYQDEIHEIRSGLSTE